MSRDNLKINYEIKPSFTTRKIKELEQENKQLKEKIDILLEDNNQLEEIRIKAIMYIQTEYDSLTDDTELLEILEGKTNEII